MGKELVYLVAKYPQKGKSKTRMVPLLGEDGAAELSRAMILDTLALLVEPTADKVETQREVCVYFAPEEKEAAMAELMGDRGSMGRVGSARMLAIPSAVQNSLTSNLTDVLRYALTQAQSQDEYRAVTFVGSDCPQLPPHELRRGEEEARKGRAYLVPASDGGYVLLSLPSGAPITVFDGVEWSTEGTLVSQRAALERAGMTVVVADGSYVDMDEPADAHALLMASVVEEEATGVHVDSKRCTRTLAFLQSRLQGGGS